MNFNLLWRMTAAGRLRSGNFPDLSGSRIARMTMLASTVNTPAM